MYQALYRKWRPKTFDDVVGQQHVTDTLRRQILLNRLSHAYLFTGTRGTGKTTCARLLARAVNCDNPIGGNPCGKCPACLGIENGSILDILEIDAASNNGVDNIRALREDAVYSPAEVKKRVFIIDEVHMLSGSAFNALLKILEEPPEHLIFILATTELHKVPATILSRCQRYSFKRVSQADISSRLSMIAKAEGIELTDEACEILSHMADGSLRDALTLLDQCSGDVIDKNRLISAIGISDSDEICRIFEALQSHEVNLVLSVFDELYSNGRDVSAVLDMLCELYRDILLMKLAPSGGTGLLSGSFTEAELSRLSSYASVSSLLSGMDALEKAITGLHSASNRRMTAELCLIRLCSIHPAAEEIVSPPPAARPSRPAPAPAPRAERAPVSEASAPARSVQKNTEPEPVPERTAESDTAYGNSASVPSYEAPESEVSAEAAPSQLDWKSLLRVLKKTMDAYLFNVLEDNTQIEALIRDGAITLMWKNPFAMGLLDDSAVKSDIASAAEKLSGSPWRVSVEEYNEAAMKKDNKLDMLMTKFNIKYDDEGE